ncbi:MAG: phosphatidylglycerophosphatase A family protein [Gammaproteobacteria bacterium]
MPLPETLLPMLAGISVGWIVLLIVLVILILFGAWRLPDISRAAATGDRKELGEVLSETGAALVVCIAQGFGIGRVPVAPGTFGSLLGLLWFVLLVASGEFWVYIAGTFGGLVVSILVCGIAEKLLEEKDPGSVVFDEIAAVPVCFLPWVAVGSLKLQGLPPIEQFFTSRAWILTGTIFVLFRAIDVLKPWPLRQSQKLPGGWGVTMDDLLAAVVVGLVSLLFVR